MFFAYVFFKHVLGYVETPNIGGLMTSALDDVADIIIPNNTKALVSLPVLDMENKVQTCNEYKEVVQLFHMKPSASVQSKLWTACRSLPPPPALHAEGVLRVRGRMNVLYETRRFGFRLLFSFHQVCVFKGSSSIGLRVFKCFFFYWLMCFQSVFQY